MVLMGPPGAGKGTQAKLLQSRFHVPHISSGDLLRAAVQSKSSLGTEAKLYMDRGELVPDDILIRAIEERLMQRDCADGFILDGFPRTIAQAEALAALLARLHTSLDNVTSIRVPRAEVIKRICGRRQCRKCGSVYHIAFDPPRQAAICDKCGGELYQREDDEEATITARLAVYERETAPLLDYYRKKGSLKEIDGVGSQEMIYQKILNAAGVQA